MTSMRDRLMAICDCVTPMRDCNGEARLSGSYARLSDGDMSVCDGDGRLSKGDMILCDGDRRLSDDTLSYLFLCRRELRIELLISVIYIRPRNDV